MKHTFQPDSQGMNKLQDLGVDVLLDLSLKADLSYYFNMYEAERRSGMTAVSTLRAQGCITTSARHCARASH